jgi:hypothetical protein
LTAVQCILGGNAASVEESQSGNLDCLALYLATLDRTDSTARIALHLIRRSFKTINKLKLFVECGIPRPQDVGHLRLRYC